MSHHSQGFFWNSAKATSDTEKTYSVNEVFFDATIKMGEEEKLYLMSLQTLGIPWTMKDGPPSVHPC